jgi:hypothetical protein
LNYSAVVVPITKADKTIDVADKDYKPLNEEDRLVWEDCKLLPLLISPLKCETACPNAELAR